MKILRALFKTILGMTFIAFCAVIGAFFVAVYNPEGFMKAIEIVRSIVG